jgi:tRNA threonylcarbamoyladenosine biosynthesis protein TsaB
MNLYLAVETSSHEFAVALGDTEQVFLSSSGSVPSAARADLQSLVTELLRTIDRRHRDIRAIGVDIGPGGLSSTRAGASYANALAFSLGVKVYPFSYFDIVAAQTAGSSVPIVCVVPAAAGNAYVALLDGSSRTTGFGPFGPTVARIVGDRPEVAVAGRLRDRVAPFIGSRINDTGIDAPSPAVLLEMTVRADHLGMGAALQAIPLNEQAPEFRE